MNAPPVLRGSPVCLRAIWLGWIAAPAWWLAQFEVRYVFVPWACAHGQRWLVLGCGGLAFAASAALAAWAWRTRRASTGEEPATFLQRGAAWSAAFFSFVVLIQMLPDLFLDPCRL